MPLKQGPADEHKPFQMFQIMLSKMHELTVMKNLRNALPVERLSVSDEVENTSAGGHH
jgi:hypothetical protein